MIIDKIRKTGTALATAAVMAALLAGASVSASAAPKTRTQAADTLPQLINPAALQWTVSK